MKTASRLCLGSGIVLASILLGACCPANDQWLRSNHAEHREELTELMILFHHDPRIVRLAPNFTLLEDAYYWPRPQGPGLPEERWQQYRALFDRTGVSNGLVRRENEVIFLVRSCGIVGSGRSIGYSYWTFGEPENTVERLEELEGKGRSYVPLGDGWYLYLSVS